MNPESVAAIRHEEYAVIRNGASLAPQRERTWRRKTEVAVAGPVGLVGDDRVFRNDQSRWHAVTSRRQNGHPIVTLMRLEMAAKSLEVVTQAMDPYRMRSAVVPAEVTLQVHHP